MCRATAPDTFGARLALSLQTGDYQAHRRDVLEVVDVLARTRVKRPGLALVVAETREAANSFGRAAMIAAVPQPSMDQGGGPLMALTTAWFALSRASHRAASIGMVRCSAALERIRQPSL